MNEEERDLESELKEEKDRYERQNQEAYDEVTKGNEELRRRQQEEKDKKTFLDEGSTFRTLTGLGVEVGGNLLLDAFSFVPGSQQAGSALLNLLQQKIRGGKISYGEIAAAAAASQIPFLQSAKALTRGGRFVRSVGRGSTAGAIDSTVRPIIDEKRAPTVGEFATGVTAGGVFGGMFDLAPSALKGNLKSDVSEITDDGKKFFGELTDALTPGPVRIARGELLGAVTGGTTGLTPRTPRRQVRVPIDGKQGELFDVRDYKTYATLGDELIARSEGVVPDPTAPNYAQLQRINQQVFRNIFRRLGGGGASGRDAFYSAVAENPDFSYVEHLIGKGRHMDWYWTLKNADRNGPDNVRLLLNDPYKQLKDVVENFGYGTAANNFSGPFLQNPNRQKRLIVGVEMPKQLLSKQGIPAIAQNQPGNIIIREAGTPSKPGRVIGKFGDYLDVLFRDEAGAIEGLLEQARQGRPALLKVTDRFGRPLAVTNTELRGPAGRARRVQLSDSVVRARYKQWRKELIEERIQEILDKKDSKLAISKKAAEQRINARILEDMVNLRQQYPWLGGRARAVEQALIDADPSLSESALVQERPKTGLAREANPRTGRNRGDIKGGGFKQTIKVKFKNGKGGEVIKRTSPDGEVTYYRKKGKGRIDDREIFTGEFTEVTPSQYAQLPLV